MLILNNITIKYDKKVIIQNLSLNLEIGEIGCLLGPSGEGKTTILRCIAGLQNIHNGKIILNNEEVSNPNFTLSPQKRKVGMLFQDYALFPHLNIYQNVEFGVKGQKNCQKIVYDMLNLVQMNHAQKQYPHQLSGGQMQRVALARALAPNPQILLLDEPFSSLDVNLKEQLAKDIKQVLKQSNTTAILVTHDQQEAFFMSDKLGVIYQQKLQQWDKSYDVYHKPKNRWIANFIGKSVLIDAHGNENYIQIEIGKLKNPDNIIGKTKVLLRADDVIHDDDSHIKAKVINKNFYGADFLYTLCLKSGQHIFAYVPSHHDHIIGEEIGIRLEIDHVITFNDN